MLPDKQLERFTDALQNSLCSFGPKTKLRDSIEYALTNGGKRFRPLIVLMVAEALGSGADVMNAALAVEFFHTASLIADDLPCMDNDDERRKIPSLHKAFDEATALLASYALISSGYEHLYLAAKKTRNFEALALAVENVSQNTGIMGACGGQYDDLFSKKEKKPFTLEIIEKKTNTLFEISFVLGWLFGGGPTKALPEIKSLSSCFGTAFQICDDFIDYEEDEVSFVKQVGKERGYLLLEEKIEDLKKSLKTLNLNSPSFKDLVAYLEAAKASSLEAFSAS